MKNLQTFPLLIILLLSSWVTTYADGRSDYDTKCSACHGFGIAGAPKLNDFDSWQTRLTKGIDAVYVNAIEGFKGETGVMPAKGGFVNLSDEKVRAVVDYMIQQSQM